MEENNSQPNKYNAALAKYNTNLSDADIQARVAELIEKKVPENNTEDGKCSSSPLSGGCISKVHPGQGSR